MDISIKNNKASIRFIVICAFLLIILIMPKMIDNALLLEQRAPGYWKVIESKNPYSIMVLPEYSDYHVFDNTLDNELNDYKWIEGNIAGLNVVRENDSLVLDGTVTETVYLGVTEEDRIKLHSGVYYVSAGIPEVTVYFEGWNDGKNYLLSNGLGTDLISIREDEFPEGFRLVMFLKEGKCFDGARVSPQIIKISDDPDAAIETANADIWQADRVDWENLTQKERKIVLNRLSHVSDNPFWTSIFLDDGTGIQCIDGKLVEGRINCFGVVNQE